MKCPRAVLSLLLCFAALPLHAQELYRSSLSSAAQAMGGASAAAPAGPLDAMSGNPAGLTFAGSRVVELGANAVLGRGEFTNARNTDGRLEPFLGLAPFGAYAMPFGRQGLYLGASIAPDTSLSATWHYYDSPGVGGADYGYQKNYSSILNLRYAAGLGYSLSRHISVGATVGLVYNTNTLTAPFIFQSQPVLAGLKTLLDLHTSGTGWNGSAGILYQPRAKLHFAASYKSRTVTHTSGSASGDLSAQLAALGITGFQPTYLYRAHLDNTLPAVVTAGLVAPLGRRAMLSLESDFVDWRHAFRELPVVLTNGSNADLNGLAGTSTLKDAVPLNWRSQEFYRAGLELPVTESANLRGGYAYSNDPVPSATLTPLTAAITQQFLTAGFGYRHKRIGVDLAYEAGLPQTAHVGHSQLRSGEYDDSRVDLMLQSVSLTTSFSF